MKHCPFYHNCRCLSSLERRVGHPTHHSFPRAFLDFALKVLYPKSPHSPTPNTHNPGQFRMVGPSRVESVSYLYPRYLALCLNQGDFWLNVCFFKIFIFWKYYILDVECRGVGWWDMDGDLVEWLDGWVGEWTCLLWKLFRIKRKRK